MSGLNATLKPSLPLTCTEGYIIPESVSNALFAKCADIKYPKLLPSLTLLANCRATNSANLSNSIIKSRSAG